MDGFECNYCDWCSCVSVFLGKYWLFSRLGWSAGSVGLIIKLGGGVVMALHFRPERENCQLAGEHLSVNWGH